MEAREGDIGQVPRMVATETLHSEKEKLKKMREDQYSLIISLQLTQK